jgi:CBS-domain-containing membrane protein
MALAALVTGEPFVFPSLGPTAFLLFSTPLVPVASLIFGLTDAPPALSTSVTGARVGAAALSLGLTSGLRVLARVPHPPAGATTLIVSLGILREPAQLAVLMVAVVLLVVQGFVINRLAGIPYPVWVTRPAG